MKPDPKDLIKMRDSKDTPLHVKRMITQHLRWLGELPRTEKKLKGKQK